MTAGPLLNISTDGDACGRKIFSDMMTNDISNYEFGKYLEDFYCLICMLEFRFICYDAKHLAMALISEKKYSGERAISVRRI